MAKRILIVEDEPDILEILKTIFVKRGHTVEVSPDGVDALSRVKTFKPELVLLDIAMPKLDGYEVCKKIKADPASKNTKVVMLTALVQKSDIEKGYKSGADGYFLKPFTVTGLVEEIENNF